MHGGAGRDDNAATKRRIAEFKRRFGPDSREVRYLMNRQGLIASTTLLNEMNKGVDINGRPFVEYSEGYKQFRIDKQITNAEKVCLAFSGKMQASINHVMVSNDAFEVGAGAGGIVKVHAELSKKHDLGYGVPIRAHLGFSRAVLAEMRRVANADITKMLRAQ